VTTVTVICIVTNVTVISEYFLQCVIHIHVWQEREMGDHMQNYIVPNVFRWSFCC